MIFVVATTAKDLIIHIKNWKGGAFIIYIKKNDKWFIILHQIRDHKITLFPIFTKKNE